MRSEGSSLSAKNPQDMAKNGKNVKTGFNLHKVCSRQYHPDNGDHPDDTAGNDPAVAEPRIPGETNPMIPEFP